eukprot:TRINITY_DN23412_c0_g1_i1.p1 TRINITY_DN23412_c0_g1~~TRINITY_DN23412_c0_g1_i1.p1  ORF type:complete len:303 (+),score=33.56 TRINITY_DN23412_c0_g1_i1:199-1107(+)
MDSLRNLVHYSCVSRGPVILARYDDSADSELRKMAAECVDKAPPHHSRFSHTACKRRYSFLIEADFVFFAIVDEALAKSRVYGFLEQARDEFRTVLKGKGLTTNVKDDILKGSGLNEDFTCVFRRLVAPLVGIPQNLIVEEDSAPKSVETTSGSVEEEEASSPTASALLQEKRECDFSMKKDKKFCPLLPKAGKHEKKKVRDQITETKEIANDSGGKGQKIEVTVEGNDGFSSWNRENVGSDGSLGVSLQRRDAGMRSKGQQLAQRMWWRNVRVVLLLDVAVCAILFAIWLGICNGFNCISE